ncbi:Uncharacterised protein [Bordetella pertussis]|nr:Uncharacterised protein [Bordetella pertussis]
MRPQACWKNSTTSPLSGSPQLDMARTALGRARTASMPSAITPRNRVGVVAKLLTRWRASTSRHTSGVGLAASDTMVAPMASAPR